MAKEVIVVAGRFVSITLQVSINRITEYFSTFVVVHLDVSSSKMDLLT